MCLVTQKKEKYSFTFSAGKSEEIFDFDFISLMAEKKWSDFVGDSMCPSDSDIFCFAKSDIYSCGISDIRLRRVIYFPSENVKEPSVDYIVLRTLP